MASVLSGSWLLYRLVEASFLKTMMNFAVSWLPPVFLNRNQASACWRMQGWLERVRRLDVSD